MSPIGKGPLRWSARPHDQFEMLGERTFPEFFQSLATEWLRRCKVFGIKASWQQIMMLFHWNIPAMFSGVRVVHITRQDSLAYCIANKARAWTSEHNVSSDAYDIPFDFEAIRGLLVDIDRANEPMRVVQGIAAFCGCDLGGGVPDTPVLQKQANAANERLVSEFCAIARAKMRLSY